MTSPRASLLRQLLVDPVLSLIAPYLFDKSDRAYIDDQARAAQQHLVESVLTGVHATWLPVDSSSASIAIGDCGCIANNATDRVTKATSVALSASGKVFGLALTAGAPGMQVRWALLGSIPPTITGLPTSGNSLYARCNTTTARVETVGSLLTSDFALGAVTSSGFLTLCPQLPPATVTGTGYLNIDVNGSALPNRNTVNIIGTTVTGADNSGASRTDITISPGILSYATIAIMSAASNATMVTGQIAYVVGPPAAFFTLDKASTLTPDGITIVSATGGGNWIRE